MLAKREIEKEIERDRDRKNKKQRYVRIEIKFCHPQEEKVNKK